MEVLIPRTSNLDWLPDSRANDWRFVAQVGKQGLCHHGVDWTNVHPHVAE
ncbi:MAG: hypothetical protein LBN10_04260 [Propionibacteriaceae bacterium]|jgi:hypothetical protein|nr:hypothetical protein [Propionibacteriaceae bacterium]